MWRDDALLLDILLAARKLVKFTAGVTWEGFLQNEVLQHAVMVPIEIIGKAARLISPEVKSAHPEVPWQQLTSMRNRLIHEYFRVNLMDVWRTIQEDIPDLTRLIEPLVPKDSGETERSRGPLLNNGSGPSTGHGPAARRD